MYNQVFLICIIFFNIYCGKTLATRKCVDSEVKYVFVATRIPEHLSVDYIGGPDVIKDLGKSFTDQYGPLLTKGGQRAQKDCEFLATQYPASDFGLEKWTKDNFRAIGINLTRSRSATVALAMGLKDNYQDIREIGIFAGMIPLIGSVLGVTNLALCGLTFLAGFYSKDLILEEFNQKTEKKQLTLDQQNASTSDLGPTVLEELPEENGQKTGKGQTSWNSATVDLGSVIFDEHPEYVKYMDPKDCIVFRALAKLPRGFSERYKKEYEELLSDEEFKKKLKEKLDIQAPYLDIKHFRYELWLFFETLRTKYYIGKQYLNELLGQWSHDEIKKLSEFSKYYLYAAGHSDDIQKYLAGPVLQDVFNKMGDVINYESTDDSDVKPEKMTLFVAPPMILVGLAGVFNETDDFNKPEDFYPDLGSMFVLELRRYCDGRGWFYQAKYRNNNSTDLTDVYLPKNLVLEDKSADYKTMLKKIRTTKQELNELCHAVVFGTIT